MKVDIFNSGTRPQWRLVVQTGQPVAPLVDDLITGVSTMVPLTLLAAGVELEAVMLGRDVKAIERFIKDWGGAVARTSEFDDRQLAVGLAQDVEGGDD